LDGLGDEDDELPLGPEDDEDELGAGVGEGEDELDDDEFDGGTFMVVLLDVDGAGVGLLVDDGVGLLIVTLGEVAVFCGCELV
jgi:hypothetical protein